MSYFRPAFDHTCSSLYSQGNHNKPMFRKQKDSLRLNRLTGLGTRLQAHLLFSINESYVSVIILIPYLQSLRNPNCSSKIKNEQQLPDQCELLSLPFLLLGSPNTQPTLLLHEYSMNEPLNNGRRAYLHSEAPVETLP